MLATYVYNHINICNIPIYFYNIRMKHTSEITETHETWACNMSEKASRNTWNTALSHGHYLPGGQLRWRRPTLCADGARWMGVQAQASPASPFATGKVDRRDAGWCAPARPLCPLLNEGKETLPDLRRAPPDMELNLEFHASTSHKCKLLTWFGFVLLVPFNHLRKTWTSFTNLTWASVCIVFVCLHLLVRASSSSRCLELIVCLLRSSQ